MDQTAYALELKGLAKHFGGIIAADGIDIRVPEKQIYGIIGPNGAGKTTMFNMVTGVYLPTSGDILFFGKSLVGLKTHEIATVGVARTFQNIRLFSDLTVYENVLTACQKNIHYNLFDGIFRSRSFKETEKKMAETCSNALEAVGLQDVKEQKANNLSYGMQRRLEIIRALMTEPKILLLDEPAAGMNQEESSQLSEIIKKIRVDYDITIIVIDHHMDVIMDVCDQISVLNFGRLLATGTPEEVQKNQDVRDAYLGVSEDA